VRAIAGPLKRVCVAYDCSVLHDCDWIKDYAPYVTPKPESCAHFERPLHALSIDTEGTKHEHGPDSSEKACNECDCDFREWEMLLGEVAG